MKVILICLGMLAVFGTSASAQAQVTGRCPVPKGYELIQRRSQLPAPLRTDFEFAGMPDKLLDLTALQPHARPTAGFADIWKKGNHWILISSNGISGVFGLSSYELGPNGKTITYMGGEGARSEHDLCEEGAHTASWMASKDFDVFSSPFYDFLKCPVPKSFRSVFNRYELPVALQKEFRDTAMPGEAFNETDVGLPGTGLKLIWTNGKRWIVLFAAGGIAETYSVRDYEVDADGNTVKDLAPSDLPFGSCRVLLDEAKRY